MAVHLRKELSASLSGDYISSSCNELSAFCRMLPVRCILILKCWAVHEFRGCSSQAETSAEPCEHDGAWCR